MEVLKVIRRLLSVKRQSAPTGPLLALKGEDMRRGEVVIQTPWGLVSSFYGLPLNKEPKNGGKQ